MKTYDKEQEKIELEFLQNKFERIFNPNKEIKYNPKKRLKPYLNAVKKSDMKKFGEYALPVIKNHKGDRVGFVKAEFKLKRRR